MSNETPSGAAAGPTEHRELQVSRTISVLFQMPAAYVMLTTAGHESAVLPPSSRPADLAAVAATNRAQRRDLQRGSAGERCRTSSKPASTQPGDSDDGHRRACQSGGHARSGRSGSRLVFPSVERAAAPSAPPTAPETMTKAAATAAASSDNRRFIASSSKRKGPGAIGARPSSLVNRAGSSVGQLEDGQLTAELGVVADSDL